MSRVLASTTAAMLTAATMAVTMAAPAAAHGGGGPSGWRSCPDASPGVVTWHEFTHAPLRLARHRVECRYGVHRPRVEEFTGEWGTYEVVEYPATNGATTDVTYLMRGDGRRLLVMRHWYNPGGGTVVTGP